MGWVIAACVSLVAWAFYWPLGWLGHHVWVPVVVTMAALAVGTHLHRRRKRAEAAAKALEAEIAQQGEQQALLASRDRRAEIRALQEQLSQGIAALKKAGPRGKTGAAALYSLPWYVIIGPPGAGKTTALKASGLRFPIAGMDGGGVRGVGGTRNCDWWLTDEAILLDTAGRYTTESDDREEWLAFLQMLKRHRSRCPIDGVLVALSVADLADASEQQIERHAKKLRARIDEVMTQLQMIVPVYVLFTKADLVAGFVEIFGDMKKSDRRQPWGATIGLSTGKVSPRALFEAHFDQLVTHVQARSIKRLAAERRPEASEKIYHFPLEFASVRQNLADLVETVFAENPYQGTPIFRGFYFVSGTQEGRPLDRVLQRMSAAMSLRPAEPPEQPAREAKSYFLHDVFAKIVFEDAGIAGLTPEVLRRRARIGAAIAAAAAALAVLVCGMAVVSFLQNDHMLDITREHAREAQEISWREPPTKNLATLKPMLLQLRELDTHREEGVPLGMGWGMYQGERVHDLTAETYAAHLRQGFVLPCKQRLEERLRAAKGDDYLAERTALKAYLMLDDSDHDFEHVDVAWATGRYTEMWVALTRPVADTDEDETKSVMAPHVRRYFTLLKQRRAAPERLDQELIAQVRKVLLSVPVARRYHDQYVRSVAEEKMDDADDDSRSTLRHPALTLPDLLPGRPAVMKFVTGATFEKDGRWTRVEGPYTDSGHEAVLRNLAMGKGLLDREAWVVPLAPEETPARVAAALAEVAASYERRYAEAWTGFLSDMMIRSPGTLQEAIQLYEALASPPLPYLQLLRALEDHTQWTTARSKLAPELEKKALALAEKRLKDPLTRRTGGPPLALDLFRIGDRASEIPALFAGTVRFGVPAPQRGGSAKESDTATGLSKYISRLDALRNQMERLLDESPRAAPHAFTAQLAGAAQEAEALVAPRLTPAPHPGHGDPALVLLRWVWCPLKVGDVRLPAPRLAPGGIRCR